MNTRVATRHFLAGSVLIALIMTGCFRDNPATPSGEADVKVTSTDPRIAFMVQTMGIRESNISKVIFAETGDTTYQVFPVISEEEKARGVLGGGFGFTSKTIDKLIEKAEKAAEKAAEKTAETAEKALEAADESEGKALAKSAHTRWDYWYSGFDVKILPEVHKIRVYIQVTGSTKLGPNWQAAIRNGIANWNAQAKGTAVSFVETTDSNTSDVMIKGSFGLGSDGTATHMAILSPEPYIEKDIVSLWVNSGHEHNGIPYNQKSTVAMSIMAMSTNITFVGIEGMYWNMGNMIHIPGTPVTDGDPETAGSSVLTYGTSPNSTPVLTQGDLKALGSLYPLHGVSAITNSWVWQTVGQESYPVGQYGAINVQISGDTVYLLGTAGHLFRKIGLTGSSSVIRQPGSVSHGTLAVNFIHSKGYLAVLTNGGDIYTLSPGGSSWGFRATGINGTDFRLDGERLTYATTNPNNPYYPGGRTIYTKYIANNGPAILTYHEVSNLTDFRTRNGLLAVADGGNVYAMQDFTGWHTLHSYWSGYAERLYLSDNLVAMYYYTPDNWTGSVAARVGGLYGNWYYYSHPVYSPDDVDVCGNNMAFLQETSSLRVVDYAAGAVVHEHFQLQSPPISKVQLTGANCDYVVTVDNSNNLRTKYGIDLNTDYFPHLWNVTALPMKW